MDSTVKDIRDGHDDLPPLRNPPLLETADDLATLSHLNEPSGARLFMSHNVSNIHDVFQYCILSAIDMHNIVSIRTRASSSSP